MLITPFSVWTPSPVLLEPAFPRLRARPPTPLPPQPPGHLPFPAFALPGGADTPVSPTVGTASSEAKVFSDLCSGEQGPGERGPGAEGRGKAELPGQPVSQSVSQSSASQPVSQSEVKGSFFKGCGLTCLCAAALLPFQRLRQRIARIRRESEKEHSLSQCSKHTSHIGGWQKHTSCVINKGADQHR
eukprot:XP_013962918.1 uncharacterized protein LOC102155390 isoform X3 [Canis lupus familiaris]